MSTIALVLLGGAVGAVLRYAVALRLVTAGFPRATLLVNAAGSLLLGATSAAVGTDHEAASALVATGLCGALTTFSTFALETARLVEQGRRRTAAVYCALSVGVALMACAGGYAAVAAS